MWPLKHISHIQVLDTNLFSNATHKTETASTIAGRLLRATHLDQSNYLTNKKQGLVNKYGVTVFNTLFQGSKSCAFLQGPSRRPADSLALTDEPHQRFSVQGRILSVGGDAFNLLFACLVGKR
jgi:hypothetical protein